MPWKHDGKVIREGRSWTSSEGTIHPNNWSSVWSDDEKKSSGLATSKKNSIFDFRFLISSKNLFSVFFNGAFHGAPVLETLS